METTINSKKLDKKVTFSRPGTSYVFTDIENGQIGTLGSQICRSGSLMGSTITFSGTDKNLFHKVCSRWINQYYCKNS